MPGAPLGEAFIVIRPRTDNFASETEREVSASINKAAAAAEKRLSTVGKQFADFGRKATIGVTLPVVAGFGLALKAASDLSEQTNKVGVVFGKAGAEVLAFSKSAATGLGVSQRAALESAGVYGNLFRAIGLTETASAKMSTRLLTLTADLASFNNAAPEEVFEALRAGLVGETEPLRRFGVNLNEARIQQEALNLGLVKGKEPLDASVKAQAAYSLILKDTSLAQGDFARTSGGLANQSRILKAQLEDTAATMGTKLIPIALKVVGVVSHLADLFLALPEPAQNFLLVATGFAALVGPLSLLVGNVLKLVAAFNAFRASFSAGEAITESFASRLGAMTRGLVGPGGAFAALGLAAAAFVIWTGRSDGAKRATEAFTAAMKDTTKSAEEMTAKVIGIRLARFRDDLAALGVTLPQAAAAIRGGDQALDALTRRIGEAGIATPLLATKAAILQQVISELGFGFQKATSNTADQNQALAELGVKSDEAATKTDKVAAAVERGFTPSERLTIALKTLGDATKSTAEKFDAFREAVDASLGVLLSAEEASSRYRGAIEDLGESIKENGTVAGALTDKQRALGDSLREAVRAADEEVSAFARAGKGAADAAGQKAALIARLEELRQKFPQLAVPIDNYIAKVNGITASAEKVPTQVTTTFTANTGSFYEALNRLGEKIRNIGRSITSALGLGSGQKEGRATGGPVIAGRTYTVGERRPETLVMYPGGGGFVIPSASPRTGAGPLVGQVRVLEGATFGAGADPAEIAAVAEAAVVRGLARVLERHEAGVA